MQRKIEAKPNRILRKNSPEREKELASLRKDLDAEKDSLKREAKAMLASVKQKRAELAEVFQSLKAEREKQGLSLAEVSKRSGMAREVIYRLESLQSGNPTISTIQRYAEALGLHVSFAIQRCKSKGSM